MTTTAASTGGEKQSLLGDGKKYGTSTTPSSRKEKHDENKRRAGGGGLLGFVAMFTNTDNARTNVKVCCSTGTCSSCRATSPQLLKSLHSSDHSIGSTINGDGGGGGGGSSSSTASGGSGSRCDNPASLPCKKKDKESCSTHRKVELDPMVKENGHTVVRSTIVCKGICCSSEVPELLSILEPLKGVAEVKVNVPLKHVIIDHDSQIISATTIVNILNDELFPSTVQRDGGASLPSIVKSAFNTKGICCSSEVPQVQKILDAYEGIVSVHVNVPVKRITVEHDCKLVSATQIAKILTGESFETVVEKDGFANSSANMNVAGVEGRSKFHLQNICCASEIPQIRSAVEPLNGVKGLMVNVATKMVSSVLFSSPLE